MVETRQARFDLVVDFVQVECYDSGGGRVLDLFRWF